MGVNGESCTSSLEDKGKIVDRTVGIALIAVFLIGFYVGYRKGYREGWLLGHDTSGYERSEVGLTAVERTKKIWVRAGSDTMGEGMLMVKSTYRTSSSIGETDLSHKLIHSGWVPSFQESSAWRFCEYGETILQRLCDHSRSNSG
jgi:hypothetical protein